MIAATIRQNQLTAMCQRHCEFIKVSLVGTWSGVVLTIAFGAGDCASSRGRLWFSFLFDESGPVQSGFGEIAYSVLVEIVSNSFAVLENQTAIDDLEGFHVNFDQFVAGNAVGAVAAENRFVFGGLFIEEVFVFLRGKEVSCAVMLARELRSSFDRFMVCEERNRIVALDGNAGFVEVKEGLRLGQQWGGERYGQ